MCDILGEIGRKQLVIPKHSQNTPAECGIPCPESNKLAELKSLFFRIDLEPA